MIKQPVLFENDGFVSSIRLNTPENGNVVNNDNLDLMCFYMRQSIESDICRVIVIEGKEGVFSKGMDFSNLIKNVPSRISQDFSVPYKNLISIIRNSPKPVIAKIDGEVVAGGVGIALACDIIIGSKDTSFCLSEVLFGLIPAYVFPLLIERVPFKKARYLILSSRKIYGEEAFKLGLIDEISDDVNKATKNQIKRLLYSSPDALRITKEYSAVVARENMENALDIARAQLTDLLNDGTNIAAIKGFLNGEKPKWAVK